MLWLLVFWAQVEVNGVTFDSNFDSGNMGNISYSASDEAWTMVLIDDNGDDSLPNSYRRWFYFRCQNVAGKSLLINLDNVYWFAGNVPVASYDGENWFRLPESGDEMLQWDVPQDQDSIYFAYHPPYTVARKNQWLDSLTDQGGVSIELIGQVAVPEGIPSEIGNLEMLTLDWPEVEKSHRIWIHARIHPGEVPPSFMLEGLVDYYLNSNSPDAQWLRANCIIHIVPMANPVGVYVGNYRTTADSINLESKWCETPNLNDRHSSTEIDSIKMMVDQLQASNLPISIALNLHATQTSRDMGHFHFKHLFPSVSENFEVIQDQWIERYAETSTQYNENNPGSSQLNSCAFIESYFWNIFGESVMALTFETTYTTRDSDDGFMLEADLFQLGQETAQSLALYYQRDTQTFPEMASNNLTVFNRRYANNVEFHEFDGIISETLQPFQSRQVGLSGRADETKLVTGRNALALSLETQGQAKNHWMPPTEFHQALTLAHVAEEEWTTNLVLTNPYNHPLEVFLGDNGITIDPNSSIRQQIQAGTPFLNITSDEAFAASAVYELNQTISAGVALQPGQHKVRLPHIPADLSRWWLGLVWTNVTDKVQTIEIAGFDRLGKRKTSTSFDLQPGEKKVQRFDLDFPDLSQSAWLEVQSEQPIEGLFLFGTEPFSAMAGYPLDGRTFTFLEAPVMQGISADWQAITLLNPNVEDAKIEMTLLGASSKTLTLDLPAGQTFVSTLNDWLGEVDATWIHLRSDQPLTGLSLFGSNDFGWIEGHLLLQAENLPRNTSGKTKHSKER